MKFLIACFFVATCTSVAHADAGIPMIALMYPLFIVTIVPVIEIYVVAKRLKVSKQNVLKPVAVANGVSMLLGYPLNWIVSLGGWVIIAAIAWCVEKIGKAPWRWISDSELSIFVLMPFQFAWVAPNERHLWWQVPVAALLGLIPAFFVSWYSEARILQKMLALDRPTAKEISFYAQAASYPLLVLIVLGYGVYSTIWHLHHG
jgi:hypothetical protein